MSDSVVSQISGLLMRAVVASGAIRKGVDRDIDVAIRVMRAELKAFLMAPETGADRYADERALVAEPNGEKLAFASLTAECVRQILAARE